MKRSDWLQQQILPGFDRYVYWLKTPLGWLMVAAIGCVLVASTLAPQMWLVFGVLVAMMMLGIAWPMIAMSSVSCQLSFDRKRCTENAPVRVRLMITNRLWFPIWGLALSRGFFVNQAKEQQADVNIALARIPGASTTEFNWDFVPTSRGVYPIDVPVLECGFPFGLWISSKQISKTQELIVWPETYRLGFIPPAVGKNQLVSETYTDHGGTAGDRIGLRPFREGDSLRLVRWAQTARFGELIVSEQQSPSRQAVTLVIWPQVAAKDRGHESAEDCIRIGASICQEFHSHGYLVRCLVGSTELLIDARSSSFRSFLDFLAGLELTMQQETVPPGNEFVEDGFGFAVTNSVDRLSSLSNRYKSVLIVDEEGVSIEENWGEEKHGDPWIKIESGNCLKTEFPSQWVKSCHASWQVSG